MPVVWECLLWSLFWALVLNVCWFGVKATLCVMIVVHLRDVGLYGLEVLSFVCGLVVK